MKAVTSIAAVPQPLKIQKLQPIKQAQKIDFIMNLLYNTGIKVVQCVTITLLLILTAYIGDITAMTSPNSTQILSENQEIKVCTRCGVEKYHNEFMKRSSAKSGIGAWCLDCSREHARENHKKNKETNNAKSREWKENNPDKVKAYTKKYGIENREKLREKAIKYSAENQDKIKEYRERTKAERAKKNKIYREANKERDAIYRKAWVEKNIEKKRESLNRWRKANPEKNKASMDRANKKRMDNIKYRVSSNISRRIRTSLFDNGSKNNIHWENILDFSIAQLKKHLEKQFDDNMSWDNYGSYWHIDHIIPIAAFNFEKPEDDDFKKCWSLKNLRPLESKVNMSKGAKIEKPFQPSLVF